jgi:hypothetical protein
MRKLTDQPRWLFIIEGAGTMVAGLLAVALLPDFPGSSNQKWLTEQEQRLAQWRLARTANDEVDENGSIKEALRDAFMDPKAWILILIQVCQLSSQTWTYFFPVSIFSVHFARDCMTDACRQLPKHWAIVTMSLY